MRPCLDCGLAIEPRLARRCRRCKAARKRLLIREWHRAHSGELALAKKRRYYANQAAEIATRNAANKRRRHYSG